MSTQISSHVASPIDRESAPIDLMEEVRVREETQATKSKESSINPLLDTAFGYQLVVCEDVRKNRTRTQYADIRPLSI